MGLTNTTKLTRAIKDSISAQKLKLSDVKTKPVPGSLKNRKFLQEYHDDVINTGRVGTDKKTGGWVTMHLGTFGIDDKTYVLPMYNPATGKDFSVKQVVDRFLPAIKAGKIKGFSTVAEAEDDLKANRKKITEKGARDGS